MALGWLWDGCEPPRPQVLCLWDCSRALCPERGWPRSSQCHPPGLSPCSGRPAEPRCWLAACQCHPGGWLSPRADTARLPGSSRRTTTSSISDDKLLLQGAFVGTRCRAKQGGKNRARWLCGRPPRREHRPRQGAAPSLPAAGGGRLKGAAWRRLKAKQLLIYNVAEREMVAKKDKDAGIAGILQPPRLRRVKPLECACGAGGGSALSLSGCPSRPLCESRGAAEAGGERW